MKPSAPDASLAPPVVALCGCLDLIPFLGLPIIGWAITAVSGTAGNVLIAYGALILSFLGGARWGLAVAHRRPCALTISLAMLPTLVALILLATPSLRGAWQMAALAAALVQHWLWNIGSSDLTAWYPRLRTILTMGAVIGLMLGAVLLPG